MFKPLILVFGATIACVSQAQTTYSNKLADFEAAAGSSDIAVDFDSISPDSNITGQSYAGAKFLANVAPLIVVDADTTYTPPGFTGAPHPETNKLIATSGRNVLSPGGKVLGPGPDPDVESDGLILEFSKPQRYFGFDLLSQSQDGSNSMTIRFYNGTELLENYGIHIGNQGGGGSPAGTDFWGVVFDSPAFTRLVITESDSNRTYPDSNVGYDSLRFKEEPVPEPASLCVLGIGAIALLRRKKA